MHFNDDLNKRNKERLSIFIIFVLVLMGFIVFSPISTILLMDTLKFPISLPEVLFLPFYMTLKDRYRFSRVSVSRIIIYISIWILLILISIIVDNYSLYAILSSARNYLSLFLVYLLFSDKNTVTLEDVMYVSIGSTLGWLYSVFYGINVYMTNSEYQMARGGNMLLMALLLIITIFQKRNYLFLFSVGICIFISLFAGLRRQIIVLIISIFISYIVLILKNKKYILNVSALMFLLFYPLYLIIYRLMGIIQDNFPGLYYRVFLKSQLFLMNEINETGDEIRINLFSDLLNNYNKYLMPKGFVSRWTRQDDTGGFIDFPLSEIVYMFGIFIAILLVLSYIYYMIKCLIRYYKHNNVEYAVVYVISFVIFVLMFIEGTMFSSSYIAPCTGFCLGRLKYYSHHNPLLI